MTKRFFLALTLAVSTAQAQYPQIRGLPAEMEALLQKENNEYITTIKLLKILDQQLEMAERQTIEFVNTGRPLEIAGLTTAIASTSIAVVVASLTKGAITPSTSRMMAAYAAGGASMLSAASSVTLEVKKNEVNIYDTLQIAADYAEYAKLAVDQEREFSTTHLELSARLVTMRNHLLGFQQDQIGAKSEGLVASVAQLFGGLATIQGMKKRNTLVLGAPVFIHIGNLLHLSTKLSRDRGVRFLNIISNTRQAIASIIQ